MIKFLKTVNYTCRTHKRARVLYSQARCIIEDDNAAVTCLQNKPGRGAANRCRVLRIKSGAHAEPEGNIMLAPVTKKSIEKAKWNWEELSNQSCTYHSRLNWSPPN